MDESAAFRDCHRMRPIAGSQLVHNMPEMNLYCFFRDKQAFPYIPIPISLRNTAQNVDLPIGERFVA